MYNTRLKKQEMDENQRWMDKLLLCDSEEKKFKIPESISKQELKTKIQILTTEAAMLVDNQEKYVEEKLQGCNHK